MIAITRPVPPSLADCQLTHLVRTPIDIPRAMAQHAVYEQTLASLGCQIIHAPAAPDLPDSVFVEDTAIILDRLAILTRPGAESRRFEVAGIEQTLAGLRPLARIEPPGTLDGGDVLLIDRTVYVGLSSRTNSGGIEQLFDLAQPHGYVVKAMRTTGCLHLKSAATLAAPKLLLINPEWAPRCIFEDVDFIHVDPAEPAAANVIHLAGKTLIGAQFPKTRARLEQRDIRTIAVDCTELAKAEAALTCCSLILNDAQTR